MRKSKIFVGEKAFFSKQKWRFPLKIHNVTWTGPLTWHTVNSALILNYSYEELNRFTGSLTYSIQRFIFYAIAQSGGA